MNEDFEQLYQTYYMKVYSFMMTLARSQHIAEEVTQKTFFKVMNTGKEYRGESSEFTWLCAIAKNLYIDEIRRQSKYTSLGEDKKSKKDVEGSLLDQEDSFRIHQILHDMEEPYKEVFQLRVFGELSFQKIGCLFSKTENWARVTYHRARLKIKERMERE